MSKNKGLLKRIHVIFTMVFITMLIITPSLDVNANISYLDDNFNSYTVGADEKLATGAGGWNVITQNSTVALNTVTSYTYLKGTDKHVQIQMLDVDGSATAGNNGLQKIYTKTDSLTGKICITFRAKTNDDGAKRTIRVTAADNATDTSADILYLSTATKDATTSFLRYTGSGAAVATTVAPLFINKADWYWYRIVIDTASDTYSAYYRSDSESSVENTITVNRPLVVATKDYISKINFNVFRLAAYKNQMNELDIDDVRVFNVATPVTGVTLSQTSLSFTGMGQTADLTAAVAPVNATEERVTWTTSDPTVATVDPSGKVTATGVGSATIRARTYDGSFVATCSVSVGALVTGITLTSPADVALAPLATYQMVYSIQPVGATNKTVTFSSSVPSVATVSTSGLITAVRPGSSVVSVTTTDGGFVASCNVSISGIPVTGISLSPSTTNMKIGERIVLSPVIQPENAYDKSIAWSSNDVTIASTVQDMVYAKKSGTATITATTTDGGFNGTSTITVDPLTSIITGGDGVITNGVDFNLSLGLNNVHKMISAEVIVTYDGSLFTYKNAIGLNDTVVSAVYVIDPGKKIKLVLKGSPSIDGNAGGLLTFTAGNTAGNGNVNINSISMRNEYGETYSIQTSSKALEISRINDMNNSIAAAKAFSSTVIEGYSFGQYPIGSKVMLEGAIATADAAVANQGLSQTQISQAKKALDDVVVRFQALVIRETTGDADRNGRVSVGDAGVTLMRQGKTLSDQNWNKLNTSDFNNNNIIDDLDMMLILNRIVR